MKRKINLFTALLFIAMSLQVQAEVGVLMQTTMGDIELSLDEQNAPLTVANFIEHVNSGYYQGTIFHRVIKNFMIQGGGFDRDMREKVEPKTIKNESSNGLSNVRGSIAMARRNDPDSASTQFFINVKDNAYLDAKSGRAGYTVFGKVISGMDVVDKIAEVETTSVYAFQNVPVEAVEIEQMQITKQDDTPVMEAPQKTQASRSDEEASGFWDSIKQLFKF